MKMLKSYTLALKKSLLAPTRPGLPDSDHDRRRHQCHTNTAPEPSHPSNLPPSVPAHTQKRKDMCGGADGGGEEGLRRERTSEEHGALVAAQVFRSWTGECPRHSFQAALAVHLTAASATAAKQGNGKASLWSGFLPPETIQDIKVLARQAGLNREVEHLVWWLVGSRLTTVDASWTLTKLQEVQCGLQEGSYTEGEMAELLHSLTLYVYSTLTRLRTLHKSFPHDHPDGDTNTQLAYTLRSLRNLESHPASRRLLDQTGQPRLEEDVAAALLRHSHQWWREKLRSCRKVEVVDVEATVAVLALLPASLHRLNHRFHQTFQTELNIPYAAISHQELSRLLAQLTKALLAAPNSPSSARQATGDEGEETKELPVLENFTIGSPLWCVYKGLGRVYSLGEDSARPPDYPGCFMGNVGAWLTHAHRHTLRRLHHPRSAPPHAHTRPSPRNDPLHELLHAIKEAGRWWRELLWPEDETCGVVAVLLLQHLFSLASALAHTLVRASSEDHLPTSTSSGNSTDSEESFTQSTSLRQASSKYFDAELCWRLTGVWRVGEAVGGLPETLDVGGLVGRLGESGRRGALEQLETTVCALLASVTQNLNTLIDQTIGRAVDKIRPRLREEVEAACEGGGGRNRNTSPPLLYLSLHNTLVCLQDHLQWPSAASATSSGVYLASVSAASSSSSSSTTSSTSKMLSNLMSPFKSSPLFSRSKTSSFYVTLSNSSPTSSCNASSSSPSTATTTVSSTSTSTFSALQTSSDHSIVSPSYSTASPPPSQTPPSSSSPSSSFFQSHSKSSPSSSFSSSTSPYQRLLQQLWDALVVEFMVLVAESTGKRPAEYFIVVQDMLESIFSLLTSPGRLHTSAATTPGYQSVMEQVRQQRVSSVALISRYYQDRYRQQVTAALPTTAHVLVRTFFSQPAHLTVKVLEARDLAEVGRGCGLGCWRECGRECGRGHRNGRRGSFKGQPKYQVTVQVVPNEVFPGASLCRTSTSTHRPPTFYDTFEFPIGEGGVEGFLQLSLVVGGRGAVVGEAFLPIPTIPYLDSPTLQNTELPMTCPAFPPGYQALTALRARAWDEQASSFVRQIERRHPQARPTLHPPSPHLC